MTDSEPFRVALPHSNKGPYKGNYWTIFEKDMKILKSDPTVHKLEAIILKHINRHNSFQQKRLLNLQIQLTDQLCRKLVPFLCDLAVKLPQLFPEGSLPCLERQKAAKVELTRLQVACLLSHMFLCTILPDTAAGPTHCGHFTGARAPTGPLTFVHWLLRNKWGPTEIYLKSLLLYFEDVMSMDEARLEEKVIFERCVSDTNETGWSPVNSDTPIIDVDVHLNGSIGDIEQVEMNFANQHVGFGQTGTQEELIMGPSPEFCVIVLFNEILEPNETILLTGAKRYGTFTGYSRTAKWSGQCEDNWDWNSRRLVAMDAICRPRDQLGDVTMCRELGKAWTGFKSVSGQSVSTGHWGCGAFGGDINIKCLVQVIAASLAGVKKLDFYCFGDKVFHDTFSSALTVLRGHTVGQLWEIVRQFRSLADGDNKENILEFIINKK